MNKTLQLIAYVTIIATNYGLCLDETKFVRPNGTYSIVRDRIDNYGNVIGQEIYDYDQYKYLITYSIIYDNGTIKIYRNNLLESMSCLGDYDGDDINVMRTTLYYDQNPNQNTKIIKMTKELRDGSTIVLDRIMNTITRYNYRFN